MSHTKRFYNFPNKIKDFYHPYQVWCCGNCPMCKDLTKSTKKRRLVFKYDLRNELKRNFNLHL